MDDNKTINNVEQINTDVFNKIDESLTDTVDKLNEMAEMFKAIIIGFVRGFLAAWVVMTFVVGIVTTVMYYISKNNDGKEVYFPSIANFSLTAKK